jgi:hypothetical protein
MTEGAGTVLIIAGSRDIAVASQNELEFVFDHINDGVRNLNTIGLRVARVLSGGARGVDRAGESWARTRGVRLDVIQAEWERYGSAAGPRRNRHMAEVAHGFSERGGALIVIRYRDAEGSASMLVEAHKRGLHVVDVLCDRAPEGLLPRVVSRQVHLRGRVPCL